MQSRRAKKFKTLRRIHVPDAIYFVTATTRRRTTIFCARSADAVSATFQRVRADNRADVLAYAVMPDHIHALLRPRDGAPIGDLMAFVKRVSSAGIRRTGHTGRVWEERFYDRVIRDEEELRNVVAYIHGNPVESGLCEDERDWPWSTANPLVSSDLEDLQSDWNRPLESGPG